MSNKNENFKKIEKHLRNYNNYVTSIKNLEKTLDIMYPKITSVLEPREGSTTTFSNKSSTEEYAIKRAEKREETELGISQYKLLVESINLAIKQLDPLEREFVEKHFINKENMKKVAHSLGYSLRQVYTIKEDIKNEFMITLYNLTQIDL